ncbi:probable insulin-like peptide 7 [Panonychus citri]|uniref:probable insulin-like peptide 7 n=1 Tax=Panonychus citri TaxID=50023 RepID=UPI0023074477|nr:probable insulin-like peptide 7 [Panonychus citri]XP_053209903.1 probable insulin-like peptide 7 [Panonychus citri]
MTFTPLNWLTFMAFQLIFCYLSPFPTILSLSTSPSDLTTWETVFQDRSDDDWRALWHTERHRRCYQELESHMRWVCNKDIYKVKKSDSEAESHNRVPRGLLEDNPFDAFISKESALNLLGQTVSSVRRKRGIIDECCHGANGCSWEEYAEYCTHNNRIRT